MSEDDDRDRREERSAFPVLSGLAFAAVAGALIKVGLDTHKANTSLAEELLQVSKGEDKEFFENEQKKLDPKAVKDGNTSLLPLAAKPRSIPKQLKSKASKIIVEKAKSDPLWTYILGSTAELNLEWIISRQMDALEKADQRASVESVAWKSAYQCLMTRRHRETTGEDADPLEVVAAFALLHGSGLDSIFARKESITGLSREQNDKLEAVGKFLNDVKLKHFFRKKGTVVEMTRFAVNPFFKGMGVEGLCVKEISSRTQMPVLIVTQIESEKDFFMKEVNMELVEAADFMDGGEKAFTSYFLVKY